MQTQVKSLRQRLRRSLERGMVVSAKWAGLSIAETYHLGFSHTHKTVSKVHTEWCENLMNEVKRGMVRQIKAQE